MVLNVLESEYEKHIRLLLNIYKASTTKEKIHRINSLEEVFGSEFVKEIIHFNVNSQAPVYNEIKWIDYITENCVRMTKKLDDLIFKYSNIVDDDIIMRMENVKSSNFMKLFLNELLCFENKNEQIVYVTDHCDLIKKDDRVYLIFNMKGEVMNDIVGSHLKSIIELGKTNEELLINRHLERYNEILFTENAPSVGSSRYDILPDKQSIAK